MRPALGGSRPRIERINVVLPEPLGPSTPMNSPGSMAKLTSPEDRAAADLKRGVVEFDDWVHEFGPVSALSRASSSPSIQSWNETLAGCVSVTPTTGTLALAAMARRRSVSFSDTCLL